MTFNVRSSYSMLQSTVRINDYVKKAKEMGYTSLAIADHNVMHGILEFYQACRKWEVHPIMGCYLDLPMIQDAAQTAPLLLFAKSKKGMKGLYQLSRWATKEERSSQQAWEIIDQFKDTLIGITPGRHGEIEQQLIHMDINAAQEIYQTWQSKLGADNFYLGLSIYPLNQLELENMILFAKKMNGTLVSNQLVNSLSPEDGFSLKVLESIKENHTEPLDLSYMQMQHPYYLYSPQSLSYMYQQEGIEYVYNNTIEVMKQLNVRFDLHQSLLPTFQTPQGLEADDYLKQLVFERLKELQLTKEPYISRLNYELDVLQRMGFSDYFLIVWQIISFCHQQKIEVGPGRGSAAGSLVSYLLKITSVDPVEFDLLFERFLNPERHSMPDIDIDIPDDRREDVLKYIEATYGHEQVAQICTYGTFGAKAAIRDTLKALGETGEERRWSQAIPNQIGITLIEAYKESSSLQRLVNATHKNQMIYQIALSIEGLPRQTSTHAAGVVIHNHPLEDYIPVMERVDQLLLTQFSMHDVEAMGLLKMDFLGLKNLKLLHQILQLVKRYEESDFDIEAIDMNDSKTLKLFQQAQTLGVFQFESPGIRNVLRKLKPTSFEDIVAVNALFRPGPMKQIDSFIKRKHGHESINYLHPDLKPILEKTYGIIVYQEQVMQVCQIIAGFSLGQADLLRRAMGKKEVHIMEEQEASFIDGAVNKGYSKALAQEIYRYIYEFASYGFNRSHAVVYSKLAYQLAFLKVHYPLYFYQALLNMEPGKIQENMTHVKKALKAILPIDINDSQGYITNQKGQLRLGFYTVKGLASDFIHFILNDRRQFGSYDSFTHFVERMPDKFRKVDQLNLLIEVGAFDRFGENRATLAYNLANILQTVEYNGALISLFESIQPKIEMKEEWDLLTVLEKEKEILGFSLSGHPLDAYEPLYRQGILTIDEVKQQTLQTHIQTIGLISSSRVIRTKTQELMAFITLSDAYDELPMVIFPSNYAKYQQWIGDQEIIFVKGKLTLDRRDQSQVIINELKPITHLEVASTKKQLSSTYYIQILEEDKKIEALDFLRRLAQKYPGSSSVIIVDRKRNAVKLDSKYNLLNKEVVLDELATFFGQKHTFFK
ncbi:DNA polymerase III subunit alpha [Dolosicoccus paucivorans]|uniref:DNA polymerase III subunit alpha n=1 Tax=Dolosicoccus paucivorans TaxID=84521 RepID=A0A1G8M5A4_9LACT|nr:DNA polymerase III subunit alpha [Dolosicoccus paucivorans]PMB85107.1 DNA polymerase III subunit alpha [Dolosicoccus paucivorans]PMC58909.1 DNA polymerase III subunit alpha [Dolosicoccus paucivorans]SDI63129.1 DNA polymerase-3 subunit alpha [Dolosicoccus paucivorans]